MNSIQSYNLSATIAIILLVPVGLNEAIIASENIFVFLSKYHQSLLLASFVVLFKLKSHLDDHDHFAEPVGDKIVSRFIGLVLGTLSWVVLGLGAVDLTNATRAAQFIAASFLVSTVWIVVHMIEMFVGKNASEILPSLIRRNHWIFLNILYSICLIGFSLSFALPPMFYLLALIAALSLDIYLSESFKGVREKRR